MGIKRYTADADSTISNAYMANLKTRASSSNMGAADILEVFSIYGQASTSSAELSRVLIKFPIDSISSDRTAGSIPASSSVSFYLKMFNAPHSQTVPSDFSLTMAPVTGAFPGSGSWQEGHGLDMETYTDVVSGAAGVTWAQSGGVASGWATAGGDYYTSFPTFTASFDTGLEDLEVDITHLVEEWIKGLSDSSKHPNYGLGIKLSSSHEEDSKSYFTKKFFARNSEYFYKRPVVEARWDSSTKDDRANVYFSSSLADGKENLNTIYLYNYIRGQLRNIPGVGTGQIHVNIFSGSLDNTLPSGSSLKLVKDGTHVNDIGEIVITGAYVSTGIYSASFAITASDVTTLFDVWYSGSTGPTTGAVGAVQYFTGSAITPKPLSGHSINPSTKHVTSITNLRSLYSTDETARFRIYTREKGWNPTIYTKAKAKTEPLIVDSGSYKIFRVVDELDVISYGTGSDMHTQLSYDLSGSYFDLDISLLEPGYSYGIKLAYYNGAIGDWVEQPQIFKFRVE